MQYLTYARLGDDHGETYDPDNDILVRQSTIGQLQMCAKRVELEDKSGYLAAVSEPLAFGQCFHHMAQHALTGGTDDDILVDMSWVDGILREQYDWSLDQVPDPQEFFTRLRVAYRTWSNVVRPTLPSPMAVEVDIYAYLGEGKQGKKIWLRGTPDVVYVDRLVDWKTGRSKWTQIKVDSSIQASLYLALTRHEFGTDPRQFDFWTYYKPHEVWTKFETFRDEATINAALTTAYDYGLMLEAGVYPATPVPEKFDKKRGWYCSPKYCGAWNICPVKYLGDGYDTEQVAIRSWE